MTTPNPYGSDLWINVFPDGSIDVDPTMREISGIAVLAQSLAMRLLTPTGSVIGAPDECVDIRSWISRGMVLSEVQQLGALAQQQLLRDQRVKTCKVAASFTVGTSTLTLQIQVLSALGPFTLTIAVSGVTVSLLLNGQPLGGGPLPT